MQRVNSAKEHRQTPFFQDETVIPGCQQVLSVLAVVGIIVQDCRSSAATSDLRSRISRSSSKVNVFVGYMSGFAVSIAKTSVSDLGP